jgi:hypothetical protein
METEKIAKLTPQNAYQWMQQMDILFRQKKLGRFLKYEVFGDWHKATYVISEQEQKYLQRVKAIELRGELSEAERQKLLDTLDDKFHSDLSMWSNNKSKALELWNLEQEQACGFIKGHVDVTYWPMLKKCETAKAMWDLLKKESTMTDVGNVIMLHEQFFKAKLMENESLVSYISRIQVITEKLADIEEPLSEYVVCYKVLSSLPEEFDTLTMTLYQVAKKELKIQLLKSKFALEDSRRASQGHSRESEEANQVREVKVRKCNDCEGRLPATQNPKHNKCASCFKRFVEKRKTESAKKGEIEKEVSKSEKSSSSERRRQKRNKRWSDSSSESACPVIVVEEASEKAQEHHSQGQSVVYGLWSDCAFLE